MILLLMVSYPYFTTPENFSRFFKPIPFCLEFSDGNEKYLEYSMMFYAL